MHNGNVKVTCVACRRVLRRHFVQLTREFDFTPEPAVHMCVTQSPPSKRSRPRDAPSDILNGASQRVVASCFANAFLGALRSSRFLRCVEPCAHQDTRGPKHERGCQPATIGNSPCSHDRVAPSNSIHNLRNKRYKTPRYSMTTCFSALGDEDIRSCRNSLLRERK